MFTIISHLCKQVKIIHSTYFDTQKNIIWYNRNITNERGVKMFFERDTYYKYIKTMESMNTLAYVIIIGIGLIIGLATGVVTLIISIPISILLANMYTFATKIKIQEMKWKIDIHAEIMKKNKEVV